MSAVGKVYLTIDKILVQIISAALGVFKWNVTVVLYNFNKMKKEVGMLLQKRTDTSAVGIYKLYEENTH